MIWKGRRNHYQTNNVKTVIEISTKTFPHISKVLLKIIKNRLNLSIHRSGISSFHTRYINEGADFKNLLNY